MKDAQKPDHISLNTLISRLKEGRFVVPDFQREFEWKPWDIRELMRSIFLDYYIGSLLLWKGKKENFEALSCEPIYGFTDEGSPEYIVLDGQQRLTAIYYAFLGPEISLPNRSNQAVFYLRIDKFMSGEFDQAFHYDWRSKRMKKILNDREAQFAAHIFPLATLGEGGRKLYKWFDGYENYWKENGDSAEYAKNAEQFAEYTADLIEQFQISYVELDKDLELDKVCDIFTQINSRGIRLDIFDLMNALLKPKGLQLKHMWRNASNRLDFAGSEKMNVYILQVMSILRQSYCSPKYLYFLIPGHEKPVRDPDGTRRREILIDDTDQFKHYWEQAVGALEDALKLLSHPQEYGVSSARYLPYISILPAFSAIRSHIQAIKPSRKLDAQRKLRHWYWASVFNNRYSGSVESTSARDFLDMRAWIDDDDAEPALIKEFAQRFRNIDLRRETKRGSSVYNGIFNLFVIQGARDWMTGDIPQHGDLDDHHIVPDSWGKKNLPSGIVNTILNRTPLSAETNRHVISNRLPNEYLPKLIEENDEETVRSILESHFISSEALRILLLDPFGPDEFEAFINERQRSLQEAIRSLLIKERLDLPPQLRQLDSDIERVELALRKTIVIGLEDNIEHLPPHINQKIEERISRALKKNPALDSESYDILSGKLEYFDLRELQDTIISKKTWNMFSNVFGNKETTANKFDQLGELRNSIRHSRSVNKITEKEGEAAILWFDKILS